MWLDNNNFTWYIGDAGSIPSDSYDTQTVWLHEFGHALGLDHSGVDGAVMEPYYEGVRRALHSDDIAGIKSLYASGPVNEAPSVTISSPSDGSIFASGASISFAGAAADTEDGDLSGAISWVSSIDGVLGVGAAISATLSDGNHTITASVTDAGSASGSATVGITVGTVINPDAVSVTSINYATEGGRNGDRNLLITVGLEDDLGDPVAGASVSIDLYRDGTHIASGSGTTGAGGTLTFSLKRARSGVYTTTVTNVTTAGLTWDGLTPPNGFTK